MTAARLPAMLPSLLRRLGFGLGIVWGVVTLTFFLLHLAPGNPAARLAGPGATDEQVALQRHILGLDRPLGIQYVEWLGRFARGDWGKSLVAGRPVAAMLGEAWPFTALLVGLSLLLSYTLGVVVGAIQATANRRVDTALSVITVTLYALPGYWLGLMLVLVFTYWLRALPAFGAAGVDADFLSPWNQLIDRVRHLVLPLATLVIIGIGGAARFARGAMLDARAAPYVLTARAKGLAESRVIAGHVLRNALVPVVTLLGLSLPALFSGAVFIEGVFAWPGVGRVLIEGVQGRDYPVVMAATAVSALLVVAGNLLADVMVGAVDPRVRGR